MNPSNVKHLTKSFNCTKFYILGTIRNNFVIQLFSFENKPNFEYLMKPTRAIASDFRQMCAHTCSFIHLISYKSTHIINTRINLVKVANKSVVKLSVMLLIEGETK